MDVTIGERGASQVLNRVLQSNELGYQYPCAHEINVNEVTSKFHAVGGDVDVDFEDRGTSFEDIAPGGTIQLRGSHNLSDTVGKEVIQIEFAFNYTRAGENVAIPGVVRTSHVIYRVADTPNAPQATPWVCVLDKAVQWAGAANSAAAVQTAMEAALNGASGWKAGQQMPLQYDTAGGRGNYGHFTTNVPGTAVVAVDVRLANFMMLVHKARNPNSDVLRWVHPVTGEHMTENIVNCLDCASLLPQFANALGADLHTSFLSLGAANFALNPIVPVGSNQWTAIAFAQQGVFSFHAVATQAGGTLGDGTIVYDSCLKLGRPDPTQFVNGAVAAIGNTRFSDGSAFDVPNSLTFALTAQPGGGKGTLNGRPSDTPSLPDQGFDAEREGINAIYTISLVAPRVYDVERTWTAPAGTNHNLPQGTGVAVRVPPAPPAAGTDCASSDGCASFEIVEGGNPFVMGDVFTFASVFDYNGEYRGAVAAPD